MVKHLKSDDHGDIPRKTKADRVMAGRLGLGAVGLLLVKTRVCQGAVELLGQSGKEPRSMISEHDLRT